MITEGKYIRGISMVAFFRHGYSLKGSWSNSVQSSISNRSSGLTASSVIFTSLIIFNNSSNYLHSILSASFVKSYFSKPT